MKHITLNAGSWFSPEDFYKDLLSKLGAPDWHGHNLDALWDSIVGGNINSISPPYNIALKNLDQLPENLLEFIARFCTLIEDAKAAGVDVSITSSP